MYFHTHFHTSLHQYLTRISSADWTERMTSNHKVARSSRVSEIFYLWGHMIGDDEDEMICSTRVPTVLCGPFQNKLSAAVLLKSKFGWFIVFYPNFDLVFAFSKEMGIVRKEKNARIIVIYFVWKIDYTKFEPSFEQEKILYEIECFEDIKLRYLLFIFFSIQPSNFNFYRKIDYIVFPNFELVDDGWRGEDRLTVTLISKEESFNLFLLFSSSYIIRIQTIVVKSNRNDETQKNAIDKSLDDHTLTF